jgi:hypothetical protein
MNGIHEVRGSIPLSSTINFSQKAWEACKSMRQAGLRALLLGAVAIFMAGATAGCDNPFDPLAKSDKIQGLTYINFSAVQGAWDSDPEMDGLEISMEYKNEFGEALTFHDKPHKITIELWSLVTVDGKDFRGSLLISKTVDYSNSDDLIRIPIEFYAGTLSIATPPADIKGYVRVRVFPPQEYPKKELVSPFGDASLYEPLKIL